MDVRLVIQRIDRLLENADLAARRHVNEVVLRVSTVRFMGRALRESLAYGYWISPDGELIEVPRMGHAQVASQLSRRYGIEADDNLDTENRWRVPFVRAGWVRVVTGRPRLTVQAMYLTSRAARVIRELASAYLPGGEVNIDVLKPAGGTDTIFADRDTTLPEFNRKFNALLARAPEMPRVPLRKAEAAVPGLSPSLVEA